MTKYWGILVVEYEINLHNIRYDVTDILWPLRGMSEKKKFIPRQKTEIWGNNNTDTYIYVFMFVCMYVCIHIHVYLCTWILAYIHEYIRAWMYVRTVCMYICVLLVWRAWTVCLSASLLFSTFYVFSFFLSTTPFSKNVKVWSLTDISLIS